MGFPATEFPQQADWQLQRGSLHPKSPPNLSLSAEGLHSSAPRAAAGVESVYSTGVVVWRREEVGLLDSLQKGSDEVGLRHHLSWFYYLSKSIKMQGFTGVTWKEHFLWKGQLERADTTFLTIYYPAAFCINMLQAACQSLNHHNQFYLYSTSNTSWSKVQKLPKT